MNFSKLDKNSFLFLPFVMNLLEYGKPTTGFVFDLTSHKKQ
jgi:hypothetical protein